MDKVERLERECEIRFESEIQLCKEIDAKNDRIAALESQLADRHAERVREIDAHTERVAGLESQLATERAARLEAEALAVWAAKNGVEVASYWVGPGDDTDYLRHTMTWTGGKAIGIDGTADAILAALRRAAKGGS